MNNAIKNFHIKQKCCTFVRNHDSEVEGIYIKNIFGASVIPSLNRLYTWNDGQLTVKSIIGECDEEKEYSMQIPIYVLRPLILQDIAIQHTRRNLSTGLIFLVENNKFVPLNISKLLPDILFPQKVVEQEQYIMSNFQEIVNKNLGVLRKDVIEGCGFVFDSYVAGGL
jgi:hypothetical protein